MTKYVLLCFACALPARASKASIKKVLYMCKWYAIILLDIIQESR